MFLVLSLSLFVRHFQEDYTKTTTMTIEGCSANLEPITFLVDPNHVADSEIIFY